MRLVTIELTQCLVRVVALAAQITDLLHDPTRQAGLPLEQICLRRAQTKRIVTSLHLNLK